MSDTLAAQFSRTVETYPQRTFLRALRSSGEQRLTYRETAAWVARAVTNLQGLGAGDCVVLYSGESASTSLFVLACAHLGVVSVPLSPSFSDAALESLVHRTSARAIFVPGDEPRAPSVKDAEGRPLRIITDADLAAPAEPADLRALAAARRAEEPHVFLPTSGSTGEPKLVVRSAGSYDYDARVTSIGYLASEEPPHRVLMTSTFAHTVGFFVLHSAVHLAAELCIPSELDTATRLGEAQRFDPTIIHVAPRTLRALYQQHLQVDGGKGRLFGPSAQALNVGGAPVEVELLRYLLDQGIQPCEGYGASETGVLVKTPRGGWREGCAGKATEGTELKLAEDGELLSKSAAFMLGYLGDETMTRECQTEDGYYRTGDYASISEDGYVRILGRKRDVFNTQEGSNVYPNRIETLLEALPAVGQVVLVGDQRPFIGALVVLAAPPAGASAGPLGHLSRESAPEVYRSLEEAFASINATLEPIERVRRFAVFSSAFDPAIHTALPSGKIKRDRKELERRYAERIREIYATPLEEREAAG